MKILREYNTYDFLERAIHGKVETPDDHRGSRRKDETGWSGVTDFSGAADLALNGWPEGKEKVERISSDIQNVVGSKILKTETLYDVAGSFADVGRFVAGSPDCMGRFVQNEALGHGKIVKIVVNVAVSAGVDPAVIMMRGAAICALLDALHEAGFSTEVHAVDAVTSYNDHYIEYNVALKEAFQPLELDRMAFVLAHPAMQRRILFSIQELEPSPIRDEFGFKYYDAYGKPADVPHSRQGDIYFGKTSFEDDHWHSLESARAWVEKELEKYGAILPSTQQAS